MNIDELEKILKELWIKETSYFPEEWSGENPAWGQCAVSALVVNDYFGGEIIWAYATLPDGRKLSHYFNLIDGKEVDLTRSQYPEGTVIPAGVKKSMDFSTTRGSILSNENTQKRYKLLRNKVKMAVDKN